MSKIYKSEEPVKFLFFTNYKVMNSNLANILRYYFPNIRMFTSNANLPDYKEYIKLAIVRNPYDRLLSLFNDKCRAHPFKVRNRDHKIFLQKSQAQILSTYAELKGIPFDIVSIEKEIAINSEEYKSLLKNFEILETITFSEFVTITETLFTRDYMDAHFAPQSEIMMLENHLLIDHYFKLENISESWADMCKLISTDMILPGGMNRTNFEGPYKYKRYYDDSLKTRVFRLYQNDFENFNYSSEINIKVKNNE